MARNVAEFWRNVRDGVECISHFSAEDLEVANAAALAATAGLRQGAVRAWKDVDQFDAAFFGDPAQGSRAHGPAASRFLECCWEALEDAGYDPQTYGGAIGVYRRVQHQTPTS